MKLALLVLWLMLLLAPIPLFAQGETQTPVQAYTAYRTTFVTATSLDELRPYLATAVLAQIDALPAETRATLLPQLKLVAPVSQVTLVTDTPLATGDHVLLVEGVDGGNRPLRGTIELTREGPTWKIVRETWRHPPLGDH